MASSSILAKMALQIGANTTEMKRGLKEASQQMNGFTKGIKAIGGVMAGAFAAKELFNFGAESVKLADNQLKAEAALQTALKGNIDAYNELTQLASAQQGKTLFGDEETIKAQALAQGILQNVDAVKKLTPIAQDLAAAKGMDLSAAFEMVAKSVASGTNAMSRYGIEIEGAAGSAERTQSAIDALTNAFGGQAEAAASTGLGPVKQFQNAWGDVREEFGKMLMPAIASVAKSLSGLMPVITEGFGKGKKVIIDVINYFIDLYNESVIFRGAVEAIKFTFKQVWEGIKLFFNLLVNSLKSTGDILAYTFNPENWFGGNFKEGLMNIIKKGFGGATDALVEYGKNTATNFKTALSNTLRKDKIPLISKETVEETNKIANDAGISAGKAFGEGVKSVDLMSEAQQKIQNEFEILESKATAFGNSFDIVGEKQRLLKGTIEDLLESGFNPMSTGIQSLIEQMNALAVATVEYPEAALTFEEVQMRIAENFKLMEDRALAFGESYNVLGEKQSYLKDQIQYLLDEGYAPLSEEVQLLKGNMESLGQTTDHVYSNMIKNMEDAASAAFSNGESFKSAAKRIVKSLIAEGVAGIISKILKDKNIPPLLSVPLAAVGGKLAGGLFNKLVPKLAEGGLAYGPTMAVVGDNRGASSNPEVIAPLSKLKEYMTGGSFDDSRIVKAIERMERVSVSVDQSGINVQKGMSRNTYLNRKLSFAL